MTPSVCLSVCPGEHGCLGPVSGQPPQVKVDDPERVCPGEHGCLGPVNGQPPQVMVDDPERVSVQASIAV